MCVTFTGCELLCCETSNWQQKSHATLKSKLRVQIKMKVMKDRNAKACRGFVWIKPASAWDGVRGGLVFPVGVRKATDQVCDSSGEGTTRWVIPGWNQEWVWELLPLTLLCLEGEEPGGPRQMDLEARKSPGGGFMIPGKKPSAKRVSPPGKAKGGSHVRHWAWLKRRRGWTSVRTKFTKTFQNGLLDEWGGLTWTLT